MINIIQMLDKCFNQNDSSIPSTQEHPAATLQSAVRTMIPYIGQTVLFEGKPVKFSWTHIRNYLETQNLNNEKFFTDLYKDILVVFNQISTVRKVPGNNLAVFKFQDQQTANAFFEFTFDILPIRNAEYPKINDNEFILTEEQYYCCEFYAMQQGGAVSPEKIGDQYFLKTLRADTLDYSHAFILGIMPNNNVTKRQNLRFVNRGDYTVDHQGYVRARLTKQPMYTAEQKKGFSQIQSCTYIDSKMLSPAFGFSKERNRKLYGLMTHLDDGLVNRMLIDDGGTVGHVFDANDVSTAKNKRYAQKGSKIKHSYSPAELKEFKAHNLERRAFSRKTNECLVRLRFNLYRSVVGICSDTLESRLLAYDFAQELLEHYADYARNNGVELNTNFRIPIIFYLRYNASLEIFPQNERTKGKHIDHKLGFYTDAMHRKDQDEALAIYADSSRRSSYLDSQNYEFLLGLPTITSEMLLEENSQGVPLAYEMIRNGYVRMLMRLLRRSKNREELRDTVFNHLINRKRFQGNDKNISQLILAEEFDIADKLLQATGSDKYKLSFGKTRLSNHLISYGNPRQLHYMGFEKILISAAERGSWVTVVLCLKEYPDINKSLLGRLLCFACLQSKHKEAELLLTMGACRAQNEHGKRALQHAVEKTDWAMVGIFAQFPTDKDDFAAYGFALLKALQHQQPGIAKLLLLAGAKFTWRDFIQNHELESALYYAIEHEYDELLPALIEHERRDKNSLDISRLWLEEDFAIFKKNELAMDLLNTSRKSDSLFENKPDLVCKLVVEALALGNWELVQYRISKHLTNSDLHSAEGNVILNGFRIIKDYIHWAFSYLSLHYQKLILEHIIFFLIDCKEITLLALLHQSFELIIEHRKYNINEIFFEAAIKKISAQNIDYIQTILKIIVNSESKKIFWEETVYKALHESLKGSSEETPYLLLSFIDTAGISVSSPQKWQFTFLSAWIYGCKATNKALCKKLIEMLGSTFIRHLAILHLSAYYRNSIRELPDQRLTWLIPALKSKFLSMIKTSLYAIHPTVSHQKILDTLNNYFSHIHSSPNDEIIISTYNTILEIFKQILAKSSPGFFNFRKQVNTFEDKMHHYLISVDMLINESTKTPQANLRA